jgi:hypothetical protein
MILLWKYIVEPMTYFALPMKITLLYALNNKEQLCSEEREYTQN